jgi:putative addiction module CopG family antidote
MDSVTLPPELERFAIEAVAAGRYRDVSDVVAAGVSLLQQAEADVAVFVNSLEAARAEAERDRWVSLEDMTAEMDRIISGTADSAA